MVAIPVMLIAIATLSGVISSDLRHYNGTIQGYAEKRKIEEMNEIDRLIDLNKVSQSASPDLYLRNVISKFDGVKVYVYRDFTTSPCGASEGFRVRLSDSVGYSYVAYVLVKDANLTRNEVFLIDSPSFELDLRDYKDSAIKVVLKNEGIYRTCVIRSRER